MLYHCLYCKNYSHYSTSFLTQTAMEFKSYMLKTTPSLVYNCGFFNTCLWFVINRADKWKLCMSGMWQTLISKIVICAAILNFTTGFGQDNHSEIIFYIKIHMGCSNRMNENGCNEQGNDIYSSRWMEQVIRVRAALINSKIYINFIVHILTLLFTVILSPCLPS